MIKQVLMKIIGFCVVVFSVSFSVHAEQSLYLEENSAYCFSERSITRYLYMAEDLDIDGLNRLAMSGQCDFVADGNRFRINQYKDIELESRVLLAFKKDGKTLWTIKSLTTLVNDD